MAFELNDLPYSHDALETLGMSKETLEFHHDLHHKAYVDNGNKLISGTEYENMALEEIITKSYDASAIAQSGVFNNASQHWNHMQFWEMIVQIRLGCQVNWHQLLMIALGLLKSLKKILCLRYWAVWIRLGMACEVERRSLKISKTENGVNPLCHSETALLGCDVWEHSYYIDFRNKRPAYLENFLDKLVNWENVASRM